MDRELYTYLAEMIDISSTNALCQSITEIAPFVSGIACNEQVSIATLKYYRSVSVRRSCYRQFHIPKKSGGVRTITAPDGQMKDIMSTLNFIFTYLYRPTDSAMAFVHNRSVVDNASRHVGHNYILNLDLKDFFTSIDSRNVEYGLISIGFAPQDARMLSTICSYPQDIDGRICNVVPQGAPTSPVLSNICAMTMDSQLTGLARRFHLTYTRYADDITFSSNHSVYAKDGEFFKELVSIIERCGFTINPKKTRLQKRGTRQEVTGITVEKHLNVSRRYVKTLRAMIFRVSQSDVLVSHDINVIRGKLNYMRMVKGPQDSTYRGLCINLNRATKGKHFECAENQQYLYVNNKNQQI